MFSSVGQGPGSSVGVHCHHLSSAFLPLPEAKVCGTGKPQLRLATEAVAIQNLGANQKCRALSLSGVKRFVLHLRTSDPWETPQEKAGCFPNAFMN